MEVTVVEVSYEIAPFRMPFKFGQAVINELTVPIVLLRLSDGAKAADGVGAMPLGNAWSFPGVSYEQSLIAMRMIVDALATRLDSWQAEGDIMEASSALRKLAFEVASDVGGELFDDPSAIPALCTLVCCSPFDIALFDAWGHLHQGNTFDLLRQNYPALQRAIRGEPVPELNIFHVVGGLDPLTHEDVGQPVQDDLPEDLQAWIKRDGLTHFKIKLQGKDPDWDFRRIQSMERCCAQLVRKTCRKEAVFSLDLNEQCPSGAVLLGLVKRLQAECPAALERIAFIEQPLPRDYKGPRDHELAEVAKIKPVVLDEGLTDLEAMERALEIGYNGVCLKACKGMGFSIQAAAFANQRGLYLCVQDLTCPAVAFMASASLAAWTGVDALEANARQFCPLANDEMSRHRPEVFTLNQGKIVTRNFVSPGLGFSWKVEKDSVDS